MIIRYTKYIVREATTRNDQMISLFIDTTTAWGLRFPHSWVVVRFYRPLRDRPDRDCFLGNRVGSPDCSPVVRLGRSVCSLMS